MRSIPCSLLLLFALATSGCGTRYMVRAEPPQPLAAPAEQAAIVFLRPSAFGGGATFYVADGQGNLLGGMNGRQYFVHLVAPGQHTFVAWGENADMIQANVQAGRIYFALVGVRMGVWSARLSLSALTTRRDEWPKLANWLQASTQMLLDPALVADRPLNASSVQRRIDAARGAWDGYDEAHRSLRVLEPGDGLERSPI